MSPNKRKKGAVALYMVIFTPIILLLFSVMLDGILTKNIKNATQRHLDVSSLAAVVASRDSLCVISDAHVNAGITLFNQNMNSSGLSVEYRIVALRTPSRDASGIVTYMVTAKATNLIGDMFIPFEYNYRFTIESTAVCNRS